MKYNILTDELPRHIYIFDDLIEINTSFRTWLKFQNMVNDDKYIVDIFKFAKENILLTDLKPCGKPHDDIVFEVINNLLEFLFFEPFTPNYDGDTSNSCITYDINTDSSFIFSVFFEKYKINLARAELHFFEFKFLFSNLFEFGKFNNIVKIRQIDTKEIKDEKQKREITKIQRIFKLKNEKKEQEKRKKTEEIFYNT